MNGLWKKTEGKMRRVNCLTQRMRSYGESHGMRRRLVKKMPLVRIEEKNTAKWQNYF